VDVDLGLTLTAVVDLDPSVELDGSEAIRRRLTPPSTSTSPVVALHRVLQHRFGRRSTSMVGSTSYVAVDLNALGQ
jgi:hypothetical protein